jgi:hypothetical protein
MTIPFLRFGPGLHTSYVRGSMKAEKNRLHHLVLTMTPYNCPSPSPETRLPVAPQFDATLDSECDNLFSADDRPVESQACIQITLYSSFALL